jgi:hypothetical protein
MPKTTGPSAKHTKFEANRKAKIQEVKQSLLAILSKFSLYYLLTSLTSLESSVSPALQLDQVKIHPTKDYTTTMLLPYTWVLSGGFTWPQPAITKWTKKDFDSVNQAILAGHIQAQYQLDDKLYTVKDKAPKDDEDDQDDNRPPTPSEDDQESPLSTPEFDRMSWHEEHIPRIQKKIGRRLRKLDGEELSEWESGSTEEEEDLAELEEGLKPKPQKKRKGKARA